MKKYRIPALLLSLVLMLNLLVLQEREEEKWLGYPGMKRRPWD